MVALVFSLLVLFLLVAGWRSVKSSGASAGLPVGSPQDLLFLNYRTVVLFSVLTDVIFFLSLCVFSLFWHQTEISELHVPP